MKRFKYMIAAAAGVAMVSLASCEKEIMTYEGQDGIYFDVRWGLEGREKYWAHQYYTPAEFGTMNNDVNSYEVSIRVTTSGTPKSYDRPFSITIGKDSTNAIEGEDYEPFGMDYVLKAGEQYAYIPITMKRSERMQHDTISLQLQLQPNEYFTCPFTNYGDHPQGGVPFTIYGYNYNAAEHKIVASDVMTKPEGWLGDGLGTGGGIMGKFTAKKWRLMMELTGTTIEDYTDERMPTQRARVVATTLGNYLMEQAALGPEHVILEEDGTMMWVDFDLLGFDLTNAWEEFTRPEDYYK